MTKAFLGSLGALTVAGAFVQHGALAAIGAACLTLAAMTVCDLAAAGVRKLRRSAPPSPRAGA